MALTGFERSEEKRTGGVVRLELIRAADVGSVTYCPDRTVCTAIIPVPGAAFAGYRFREYSAEYREVISFADGQAVVGHELSFTLARLDGNSRNAAAEIAEASRGGIVALATTACGDTFLVGHSPEFGDERPLRIRRNAGSTGREPHDGTGYGIVLYSEDTAPARRFVPAGD